MEPISLQPGWAYILYPKGYNWLVWAEGLADELFALLSIFAPTWWVLIGYWPKSICLTFSTFIRPFRYEGNGYSWHFAIAYNRPLDDWPWWSSKPLHSVDWSFAIDGPLDAALTLKFVNVSQMLWESMEWQSHDVTLLRVRLVAKLLLILRKIAKASRLPDNWLALLFLFATPLLCSANKSQPEGTSVAVPALIYSWWD